MDSGVQYELARCGGHENDIIEFRTQESAGLVFVHRTISCGFIRILKGPKIEAKKNEKRQKSGCIGIWEKKNLHINYFWWSFFFSEMKYKY